MGLSYMQHTISTEVIMFPKTVFTLESARILYDKVFEMVQFNGSKSFIPQAFGAEFALPVADLIAENQSIHLLVFPQKISLSMVYQDSDTEPEISKKLLQMTSDLLDKTGESIYSRIGFVRKSVVLNENFIGKI